MSLPRVRVVAAEIERDGAFLITQRRAEAALPNLWEFPGGRVRVGESDAEALKRTLRDRLGTDVQIGHKLLAISHDYDGYSVDFVVYRCAVAGEPKSARVQEVRWVAAEDLDDYDFPSADQASVDQLLGERTDPGG